MAKSKEFEGARIMLRNKGTKVHIAHVGGRTGCSDLPLQSFRKDVYYSLFDADDDSVKEDTKHEEKKGKESNIQFISAAFWKEKGTFSFYINDDPYTSSLYIFNHRWKDYILDEPALNYVMSRAATVKRKVDVECTTVDSIFKTHNIAPDMLSLDVQGAEYDVLMGAKRVLSSSVLAVRTEVDYIEMYKNQKTFFEVASLLLSHDYFFVEVEMPYDMYDMHSLDFARGKGLALSGDAFFIKDYRAIALLDIPSAEKVLMLFKLAAFALSYSMIDYAYQCLRHANKDFHSSFVSLDNKRSYVKMCREFFREYDQHMKKSFKDQRYYSSVSEHDTKEFESTKNLSDHTKDTYEPGIARVMLIKCLKSMKSFIYWLYFDVLQTLSTYVVPMNSIERILKKHGLKEQASFVKRRRLRQVFFKFFRKAANIVGTDKPI